MDDRQTVQRLCDLEAELRAVRAALACAPDDVRRGLAWQAESIELAIAELQDQARAEVVRRRAA